VFSRLRFFIVGDEADSIRVFWQAGSRVGGADFRACRNAAAFSPGTAPGLFPAREQEERRVSRNRDFCVACLPALVLDRRPRDSRKKALTSRRCSVDLHGMVQFLPRSFGLTDEPGDAGANHRQDMGTTGSSSAVRQEDNKLRLEDRAAHDWYRFVLSFPPHLVRDYLQQFGLERRQRVLDPFCGTGTSLVECKKSGFPSIGIEANPVACFASRVKLDWGIDPNALFDHGNRIPHNRTRAATRLVEAQLLQRLA